MVTLGRSAAQWFKMPKKRSKFEKKKIFLIIFKSLHLLIDIYRLRKSGKKESESLYNVLGLSLKLHFLDAKFYALQVLISCLL